MIRLTAAAAMLAFLSPALADPYERCSELAEYTNPLEKREWERCLKAGGPELAPEAYMLLAVKPGTNKPVTLGPFTRGECRRMMVGLKREANINSLCRRRSDGRPLVD